MGMEISYNWPWHTLEEHKKTIEESLVVENSNFKAKASKLMTSIFHVTIQINEIKDKVKVTTIHNKKIHVITPSWIPIVRQ